ncbi:hypothetical protein LTR33_002943 [Friedmanniomyces endolithicus]|nr:hypothetical protein LTR33_002943 [Friedmanniomyces endolithicus]
MPSIFDTLSKWVRFVRKYRDTPKQRLGVVEVGGKHEKPKSNEGMRTSKTPSIFTPAGVKSTPVVLLFDSLESLSDPTQVKNTKAKQLPQNTMTTFNYHYFQARFSIPDPYYVLDLKKGCTPSEAQRAYIKLALLVHPDKAADPTNATELRQRNELAGLLNAAYDVYKKHLLAATLLPEVVTKKPKKQQFEKPTPEQYPLPEDVPWVSKREGAQLAVYLVLQGTRVYAVEGQEGGGGAVWTCEAVAREHGLAHHLNGP